MAQPSQNWINIINKVQLNTIIVLSWTMYGFWGCFLVYVSLSLGVQIIIIWTPIDKLTQTKEQPQNPYIVCTRECLVDTHFNIFCYFLGPKNSLMLSISNNCLFSNQVTPYFHTQNVLKLNHYKGQILVWTIFSI